MTDEPSRERPIAEAGDGEIDGFDLTVEPASPADAAAQAPYRRMVQRLRQLPLLEPPAGWEERSVARLRAARAAERRRRALLVGVGVAGLAAAAVLILSLRRPPSAALRGLELAVAAPDGVKRRGPAAIGDRLHVSVPWSQVEVELRVYRGDRLVARCPAAGTAAVCKRVGPRHDLDLELELRDPGSYRVVAIASAAPVPPPGDGGLDGDLLAARSAGATIVRAAILPVR